jgi:hypothetical protein
MSNKFSVDFVSPVEFERLAAEISLDGQLLCRIRSERADRELEIEFHFEAREPDVPVLGNLDEFLQTVHDVAEELRSLSSSD